MRSKRILALSSVSIIFCFLIFSHSASVDYASADTGMPIPQWFHDKTSLWLSGNIDDQEFMQAIHDLITNSSSSAQVQANQVMPTNETLQSETSAMSGGMKQTNSPSTSSATTLQSKDCDDTNFPKVDWSGCDKSNSYLNHADLDDANLEGVNLSHANLFKADLAEAHLENAILDNAEMTNIDLPESHLSGASFVGVDAPFSDFNLMNAINTNFTNANLHDSSMRWAHTHGLIFKGANLNHVLFMNSDLSDSDFRDANLADAGFAYDNLTNANFDGVNLMNIDLGSAIVTGAHLHCMNNPICN